jgi:hypothetical protein
MPELPKAFITHESACAPTLTHARRNTAVTTTQCNTLESTKDIHLKASHLTITAQNKPWQHTYN